MDITLTRYQSTSDGTFGQMIVGDKMFYTVERAWLNNKPFFSCVPAGLYRLVPHKSPKFGDVFCLVSDTLQVTRYEEQHSKRYSCLIHAANYARNVQGCIGVGEKHVNSMVTSSMRALTQLYKLASVYDEHLLHIKWGEKL